MRRCLPNFLDGWLPCNFRDCTLKDKAALHPAGGLLFFCYRISGKFAMILIIRPSGFNGGGDVTICVRITARTCHQEPRNQLRLTQTGESLRTFTQPWAQVLPPNTKKPAPPVKEARAVVSKCPIWASRRPAQPCAHHQGLRVAAYPGWGTSPRVA